MDSDRAGDDILIYLLTANGLKPGGSSTVHIYTQTIHRTTQLTQTIHITTQLTQTIHITTQLTNWDECGPCPVFSDDKGDDKRRPQTDHAWGWQEPHTYKAASVPSLLSPIRNCQLQE